MGTRSTLLVICVLISALFYLLYISHSFYNILCKQDDLLYRIEILEDRLLQMMGDDSYDKFDEES